MNGMKNGNEGWSRSGDLRKLSAAGPDDSSKERMLRGILAGLEKAPVPRGRWVVPALAAAALLLVAVVSLLLFVTPGGDKARPVGKAGSHELAATPQPEPERSPWIDESGAGILAGTAVSGTAGVPRTLRILSGTGLRAVAYVHEDGDFEPLDGGEAFGRVLAGTVDFEVGRDPRLDARFSIVAGGARVTVLGTAFSVSLAGGETVVAVHRGLVSVDGPGARSIGPGERWSSSGFGQDRTGASTALPGMIYEPGPASRRTAVQENALRTRANSGKPPLLKPHIESAKESRKPDLPPDSFGKKYLGGEERGTGTPGVSPGHQAVSPGKDLKTGGDGSEKKAPGDRIDGMTPADKSDRVGDDGDHGKRGRDDSSDRVEKRRQKTKAQRKDKQKKNKK